MPEEKSSDGAVLFAYDGSDHSKAAIEQAGRHLRPGRAAIVLTVVEPLEAVPFWGGPLAAVPAEVAEEVTGRARSVVEEGTRLARDAGFEAESLLADGAPIWTRIVAVAEERDAGIIVVGSHGHTGLSYVLLGSVATAVSQHSKRPVLIAREVR